MSKQDCIEIDGIVDEVCPGAIFKVKIANGHIITTYLSVCMKKKSFNSSFLYSYERSYYLARKELT